MEKRYCLNCGKEITTKDKRQKFCCQSCAATFNNKKRAKKELSNTAKKTLKTSHLVALTKEELERLLLNEGLSFFYISKIFNCCPKTVKKRADKFGINYKERHIYHYEDENHNHCAYCGKPIKKRILNLKSKKNTNIILSTKNSLLGKKYGMIG